MSQMAHPRFSSDPKHFENKILYLNLRKPKFCNYGGTIQDSTR